MSRPLRVAVLGFGMAGADLHAAQVAATPGLRVAFVVTRDPVRAARARLLHPGVEVLASAEEVWARAPEVDLVVVATPNRSHAPLGRPGVPAGLPVVVDKPLAPTAPEALRLVDAADGSG